jgi:hypothetical protein
MMLESGISGRARVVRCETVGGVVEAFLRGRPGPRLGIVVSGSVGFVVAALGFVGEAGVVVLRGMSVEALWVAYVATSGRQRMRLRDPVGRPLVRGASIFMVAVGELGRHGGGGRGLRMAA